MKKEFTIGKHGAEPSIEPKEDFFNFDVEFGLILEINLIISVIKMVFHLITHDISVLSAVISPIICFICFLVYIAIAKHEGESIGIGIRFSIWR